MRLENKSIRHSTYFNSCFSIRYLRLNDKSLKLKVKNKCLLMVPEFHRGGGVVVQQSDDSVTVSDELMDI